MLQNFRTYEFVPTIRKIIHARFCEYYVTYVVRTNVVERKFLWRTYDINDE